MPFRCPQCSNPGSLEIGLYIQLPPDSRSDDILIQLVECLGCGFRGVAVYEESRRGSLESEAWDHTGYEIDAAELDALARAIGGAGAPRACPCPAHQTLGRQDGRGRWLGLPGQLDLGQAFRMDLISGREAGREAGTEGG
jgi:hypothetical protein